MSLISFINQGQKGEPGETADVRMNPQIIRMIFISRWGFGCVWLFKCSTLVAPYNRLRSEHISDVCESEYSDIYND